jgi:transcriptional regulator with XRE-family HTH domain
MPARNISEIVRARIRALRIERGMTQEGLCERASISIDAVTRIERGSRTPTIDTLEKIAAALDVGVADLVKTTAVRPAAETAPIRRIAGLLRHESEAVQRAAEDVVRVVVRVRRGR